MAVTEQSKQLIARSIHLAAHAGKAFDPVSPPRLPMIGLVIVTVLGPGGNFCPAVDAL